MTTELEAKVIALPGLVGHWPEVDDFDGEPRIEKVEMEGTESFYVCSGEPIQSFVNLESQYCDVKLGEALIFDRALSEGERELVTRYLAEKWKIAEPAPAPPGTPADVARLGAELERLKRGD